MADFKFTLENGKDGLLISSYMQKFIREGDHNGAYRMAKMYYPKYRKYLAKRLRQCLPEEIGRANLEIYPVVLKLCDQITAGNGGLMTIQRAIWILCQSRKNKWTDLSWIWHKYNPMFPDHPVPKWNRGWIRNQQGKNIVPGFNSLQDWLKYYLEPFDKVAHAAARIRKDNHDAKTMHYIADALEKNSNSKSCKGLGCWIFLAAELAYYGQCIPDLNHDEYKLTKGMEYNPDYRVAKLPNYFNDMHTLIGKKRGRDQIHWFTKACRVDEYHPLPTDGKYDPLKSGFNEVGERDPQGMTHDRLSLVQTLACGCLPDECDCEDEEDEDVFGGPTMSVQGLAKSLAKHSGGPYKKPKRA